MSRFDVQNAKLVHCHLLLYEWGIWLGQGVLAEPDLDGNLPVSRRADLDIIPRIVDDCPGRRTQLRVVQNKPEEGMGVEQDPHPLYSSKSFKCSSSSETMV